MIEDGNKMPEMTSQHIVEAIDRELDERVANLEVSPKLAILSDNLEHKPSQMYVGMKQRIAKKLGILVSATFTSRPEELLKNIWDNNIDPDYHGIIVQLPMAERSQTDRVLNEISAEKDVDGLASDLRFDPATPLGILTLVEGYNIDYQSSNVVIIGKGKLVGLPLYKLMQKRGAENVQAFDITTPEEEKREGLNKADIIISATGQPGLLVPSMFDKISSDRVFIDAGAAESGGVVVGDISEELREKLLQTSCLITPIKGGVGPLTVRALLSNVVTAAEDQTR